MGRITYHPRPKNKNFNNVINLEKDVRIKDEGKSNEMDGENKQENILVLRPENVKAIGDISCDYHIYLEDYVYTYLYQYACLDLKKEQSALFVGNISKETKEVAIWGVIPIEEDMLDEQEEWLSKEAMKYAERERDEYFKDAQIVGWMHMQPGYGTMVTVKELKTHREFFGQEVGIILLLDPINRIETFCICEGEELREQTGYCMYYERNEPMQRYMLEHPLIKMDTKEVEDNVVAQFREIGKKRKKQYIQRRKTNTIILGVSAILIILSAMITKTGANDNKLNATISNEVVSQSEEEAFSKEEEGVLPDEDIGVKVIINKEELISQQNNNEVAKELSDDSQGIQLAQIEEKDGVQLQSENESKQVVEVNQEINDLPDKEEGVVKSIHSEEKIIGEVAEEKETTNYKEYVIQPGDTLRKISYNHYQTEMKARDIAKFNNMTNTDHIQIGQKIKIPLE